MSDYDFYLDLSGTACERGRAHGESLRSVIQNAIGQWQQAMEKWAEMPFAELLQKFNAEKNYQVAIEQWTPHLAEEVRGIAEGANLDEELIYTWQMVDEFIDFMVEYVAIEKCSTVGGYAQGEGLAPVLGKTQDLPHCYIGSHALIRTRYPDSDVDIFNATIAGIVCQDGMSRKLGVCLNHIGQLERSSTGLPVTFIARLLLERCVNIGDAEALLKKITHASGMNYGLIDKQTVRTFEVSANHVEEFLPAPEFKRIWHTNHAIVNQHYCPEVELWEGRDLSNTKSRMAFLEREAAIADKPLNVARTQELLSSREIPISSQAEDAFPTINSIVMEFTEQPTMFFSPGPPSQQAYIPFILD